LARRVITLGVAAATASGLGLADASSVSSGAAQTVPGTLPLLVQGATDLGAAPNQQQTVTVALPLSNQGGLHALISNLYDPTSTEYHQFLSPATFTTDFGPSTSTVAAVESWATSANLQVGSVSANHTLIQLRGTRSALGQAFGVSFDQYQAPGGQTYVSNTSAATIPSVISGDVSAVLGLSDLGQVSLAPLATPGASSLPSVVTSALSGLSLFASSSLSYPASYTPQEFWSFYNAPAQTGAGQTIAVLAEGDLSQPQADLVTFEQQYGLPEVPWTTVPTGAASTDTSGDEEWDLDTQYSTAMAEDVSSLLVYDAPSLSDSDIATEMNDWVTDDQAKEANFSAGECELLADADGFLTTADQVLEQGVAQGQTLFTAAGDTGGFCPALVGVNGVPLGLPGPDYPASSPYAVAVGGTSILGLPSPLTEIGWYAGGGGPSLLEPEPGYQANVGGSNLGLTRGVPDVAFDADPNSGFDIVSDGQTTVVGGTSGSSPSWLGVWARAQAAHGGSLGFADDTIYTEPAGAFNDITVGDNVPYPCTPGYDYVTGRGTPDMAAFVADA
jgi:pseudomonalisin